MCYSYTIENQLKQFASAQFYINHAYWTKDPVKQVNSVMNPSYTVITKGTRDYGPR